MSFEMEENLEASVKAATISHLATQIYPQLLMHTTTLLQQGQVIPSGGSKSSSAMSKDFDLYVKDKKAVPTAYRIIIGSANFQWPVSYRFKAAYLKMEPWSAADCGTGVGTPASQDFDIPAAKVFELKPPADPTQHMLMITGQLTGCVICWRRSRRDPETLFIAHLQPEPDAMGEDLQQDIRSYGSIRGARVEGAFGRQQYGNNPRCCNFYGVWDPAEPKLLMPGNGRWRFFAQMQKGIKDYSMDKVVEVNYY